MKGWRIAKEKSEDTLQYDVFISSDADHFSELIAEKLEDMFKSFRPKRGLTRHLERCRIRRVYHSKNRSHELSAEEVAALKNSRFLVILCTPGARQAQKTNDLIRQFKQLGRSNNILPLLLNGTPAEAFPTELCVEKQVQIAENGQFQTVTSTVEPIAANIAASTGKKSLKILRDEKLRLIAPILGCTYTTLRQYHKERFLLPWANFALTFCLIVSIVSFAFSLPFWSGIMVEKSIFREKWQNTIRITQYQPYQYKLLADFAHQRMDVELIHQFQSLPVALQLIKQRVNNFDQAKEPDVFRLRATKGIPPWKVWGKKIVEEYLPKIFLMIFGKYIWAALSKLFTYSIIPIVASVGGAIMLILRLKYYETNIRDFKLRKLFK